MRAHQSVTRTTREARGVSRHEPLFSTRCSPCGRTIARCTETLCNPSRSPAEAIQAQVLPVPHRGAVAARSRPRIRTTHPRLCVARAIDVAVRVRLGERQVYRPERVHRCANEGLDPEHTSECWRGDHRPERDLRSGSGHELQRNDSESVPDGDGLDQHACNRSEAHLDERDADTPFALAAT